MNYLVIGNGAAGTEAAVHIRRTDPEGDITIISRCTHPYYYKPRLIDYLADKVTLEQFTIYKEDFYQQHNIIPILNTEIVTILPERNTVRSGEREEYGYDRLLLATGAACFIPPIEGAEKGGVFTIRGVRDCNALKSYCKERTDIVIVGGGLLGLEIADSLNAAEKKTITVIEVADRLLPKQLDVEGAALLRKMLEEKGLSFELPDTVRAIEGKEHVEQVTLGSGKTLKADAVVISSGIRGRSELAREAGAEVNKGIVVNSCMRTSVENIWAAGDPIEHEGKLFGIWPAAREQGKVAGLNMAGVETRYTGTLFSNILKVTEIDLYSAGEFNSTDGEILISRDEAVYRKFIIKDNELIGSIVLGDPEAVKAASRVIEGKDPIEKIREFY